MPPDLTLHEIRQDKERVWFLLEYSRPEPAGEESAPADGEVVMGMLVNDQPGSRVVLTGTVPRRSPVPVWVSCPKAVLPEGQLDLGLDIPAFAAGGVSIAILNDGGTLSHLAPQNRLNFVADGRGVRRATTKENAPPDVIIEIAPTRPLWLNADTEEGVDHD